MKSAWGFICKIFCSIFNFLLNDKIPVWLTFVFAAAGAAGTYYIAPVINQTFEIQRARREFIVDSLKGLSASTSSLIETVTDLVGSSGRAEWDKNKDKVLVEIRKSQLEAVKLVFVSSENAQVVVSYQESMRELQRNIEDSDYAKDGTYREIKASIRDLSEKALRVNLLLFGIVGLR